MRNIVLPVLITIALFVVLLEVTVRVRNRLHDRGETAVAQAVPKAVPGKEPEFQAPIFDWDPYLIVYNKKNMRLSNVTTNSKGFRGMRELIQPKPLGVRRVFVMGGSAAVGALASGDSATMPAQLEILLKTKYPNEQVEVFNAGCAGFNSTQDVILLSTRILDLEPDLIVVFSGGTDINLAMFPEWEPGYHELIEAERGLVTHPWYEHSAAYKFISMNIPHRVVLKEGTAHPEVGSYYKGNVERMASLATGAGVRFLAVLQPALVVSSKKVTVKERATLEKALKRGGLRSNYPELARILYPAVQKAMAQVKLPSGAYYLDGSDLFKGTDIEAFSDAFHLTDTGYHFAAQVIADFIAKHELLTPSSSAGHRVAYRESKLFQN